MLYNPPSMIRASLCLALAGCALGLDDPDASDEQESGTTQYLSIVDFSGIDQGAWYDLGDKLRNEFLAGCGDGFCTGAYANFTPLTLSCSVTSKLGTVHDCAWTFAASKVAVDGATAKITVDAPTFECHIHPRTTAKKLIALLATADDALHTPLPGTTSLADSLGGCFANPIGSTPVAATSPTTYVEAGQYYTSTAGQQRWHDARAALVLGFDNVCGDTFCGGDFGDLRSLDFACAITKSTGNVKSCAWTFGGSFATVTATTGVLVETSRSFTCPVAVHATLPELITTLTAAGTEVAIHRPLPGGTGTAYDSLLGCLP